MRDAICVTSLVTYPHHLTGICSGKNFYAPYFQVRFLLIPAGVVVVSFGINHAPSFSGDLAIRRSERLLTRNCFALSVVRTCPVPTPAARLSPCANAWTIGLVSGSGGNFDDLVGRQFVGTFPCCTTPTIQVVSNEIIKIPTTTRNLLCLGALAEH